VQRASNSWLRCAICSGRKQRASQTFAKDTGLTRQTVYRIKGDPAGSEGALVAWGL
jgi:hypothetical protein